MKKSMLATWKIIALATLCCAPTGACRSATDLNELSISFAPEISGGHFRTLRTYDLEVLRPYEDPRPEETHVETSDISISNDAGLRVRGNGTRNLLRLGYGDEEQFRQLVASMDRWAHRELPERMEALGIDLADARFYWSPGAITCKPGRILATRNTKNATDHDFIGALILVKSYSNDELVLLVAPEPLRGMRANP